MKLMLLSKGILTVLAVVSQAAELVVSATEKHELVTPTLHPLVKRSQATVGGTFIGYFSTIILGTTSWLPWLCNGEDTFATSSTFWACCPSGLNCAVWYTSCSNNVAIAGTQPVTSQCTSPSACRTIQLYKSLGDPNPLLDLHCNNFMVTLYEQTPSSSPPSTTSSSSSFVSISVSTSVSTSPSSSITQASSTSSSGSVTIFHSSSTTQASSTSSSTAVGAIVGGVIGGVALVAFGFCALLILRRLQRLEQQRKQQAQEMQQQQQATPQSPFQGWQNAPSPQDGYAQPPDVLPHAVYGELSAQPHIGELPGSNTNRRF